MMKKVILGKNKIAYLRRGKKGAPKLVMLHPLFTNSICFRESIVDSLGKKFDILALDFPGFGLSDPLKNKSHTLFSHTKIVREVCDYLDFKPFHLLGSSLGGVVSINFAVKYPDYVQKLILHAAPWNRTCFNNKFIDSILLYLTKNKRFLRAASKVKGKVGDRIIFGGLRLFRKEYGKYDKFNNLSKYSYRTMDFRATVEIIKNIQNMDLAPKVKKIKKETLIFVGDKDNVVFPYKVQLLSKMIKGSKFKEIKGGTHSLILDRPKKVVSVIRSFLLN